MPTTNATRRSGADGACAKLRIGTTASSSISRSRFTWPITPALLLPMPNQGNVAFYFSPDENKSKNADARGRSLAQPSTGRLSGEIWSAVRPAQSRDGASRSIRC